MTTISAGAPSIGDVLAQLISGASAGGPALAKGTSSASAPAATSADSPAADGPATFVTLSNQAKAAAAARAQSDQTAADRLQAYVEAHRINRTGNGTNKTTATGSSQGILDANTQSTATPAADTPPTGGTKVAAIVAQIKTLAGADDLPQIKTFTPTKTLSNGVTFEGYTLTLSTNASTQYYGIKLSGNGVQADSQNFGPSASVGGSSGGRPGVTISTGIANNLDESLGAITITQNVATASSASASSSSAGSVSESSLDAESSSITFLVNYATGQISVEKSAASVSVRSASVGAAGSAFSTLA
jgi:hypothetical protein